MPRSTDDFLAHYGVKGMQWGKRKSDEGGSRDSGSAKESTSKAKKGSVEPGSSKGSGQSASGPTLKPSTDARSAEYKAAYQKPIGSSRQQAQGYLANQKKFLAKAGVEAKDDDVVDTGKGFPFTRKQVAIGLVGVAVVGGIVYAAHKNKGLTNGLQDAMFDPELLDLTPGSKVSADLFLKQVASGKNNTWGMSDFVQQSSFHEGFTLPQGHDFFRLSSAAESAWSPATYSTSNLDDFNRYVVGFKNELGLDVPVHKIQFKAVSDIKVPSLVERLETLKEVVDKRNPGNMFTDRDILRFYNSHSGGDWSSSEAKDFFKALRDKGFGAIIDDMDAGVIGDSPLVLINPDLFSSKTASLMNAEDFAAAAENLRSLANPKG